MWQMLNRGVWGVKYFAIKPLPVLPVRANGNCDNQLQLRDGLPIGFFGEYLV